jgi:hypothetical protein
MKLFAIYIGGIHEKALIELHDVRFIIADKIEDTYETLRASWWGTKKSLHLDAWVDLQHADGYKVSLKNEPANNEENKLYFVNLGGYNSLEFTELHKNVFVVAPNESKAKVRALKQILHWESHHRDYQYEMENIINLSEVALEKGLYIHLEAEEEIQELRFNCKFLPIGN